MRVQNHGCQTDLRESEAQTLPWTPPYIVISSETPEVLTLDCLTWGNGLPAGQHEVEIIERLRKKRSWEKYLTVIFSPDNADLRKRIISEIQQSDWDFREEEIDAINELRMEKAKEQLNEREEYVSKKLKKRLDNIMTKAVSYNEQQLKVIKRENDRALRKIEFKRRGVCLKYRRESPIEAFTNPSSQFYAPVARYGWEPRERHEQLYFDSLPSDLKALVDLFPKPLKPSLRNQIYQPPKHSCVRSGNWTYDELLENHRALQELSLLQKSRDEDYGVIRFVMTPPRPTTPSVMNELTTEELVHETAALFQRIIRGRAVQTLLFSQRMKMETHIDEFKTAFAMLPTDYVVGEKRRRIVMKIMRAYFNRCRNIKQVQKIRSMLQSNALISLIDFSANEMVRLQDEVTCRSLGAFALNERNRREAQESGRRQFELRRRLEEEEMNKRVMKSIEMLTDRYLSSVISDVVEDDAIQNAEEEAKQLADKIEHDVQQAKLKNDPLIVQEMVAKLVQSFMLPEAEKLQVRKNLKMKQSPYLKAAKEIFYKGTSQKSKICTGETKDVCKVPQVKGEEELKQGIQSDGIQWGMAWGSYKSKIDVEFPPCKLREGRNWPNVSKKHRQCIDSTKKEEVLPTLKYSEVTNEWETLGEGVKWERSIKEEGEATGEGIHESRLMGEWEEDDWDDLEEGEQEEEEEELESEGYSSEEEGSDDIELTESMFL